MNKLGNYFSDKYLMTSDSIPTEGSFEVGDIVINTGENISEEPFWICTESGTPGVWQSINVKSTTKMVSFKNKVILTEATNTVNIGIDSFNIERDTLIVFINDAYAYEHVDYVIDGTNIKTLGNKIWNEGLIEDFVFEFIVFKSILCIDESGTLLLDQIPNGTLTINKFSQDIQEKLDFATTDLNVYQKHTEQKLPTNDKTIVGAINELFQNVDSGKTIIANAIDNESITKDSTFEAMSNAIENLKQSSENELRGITNLKTVLSDEGVAVTEDDNLASLITKTNNRLDNLNEQITSLNSQVSEASSKYVYLYNEGVENEQFGGIVDGYTIGNSSGYGSASRAKNEDHLYITEYGGKYGNGLSYETGTAVDLTEYSLIGIDWEGVGGNKGYYEVNVCTSPQDCMGEGRELYTGNINSDSYYPNGCTFARRKQFLDVTNLTGSYYISVGVFLQYSDTSYYGALKVYKIWLIK